MPNIRHVAICVFRDRNRILVAPGYDEVKNARFFRPLGGAVEFGELAAVRDHHLRTHPETAQKYGELKKQLAREFPHDIESYIDGKTELILEILQAANLSTATLDAIERANRKGGITARETGGPAARGLRAER